MSLYLEVGAVVVMPARPDWGRGQIQSLAGRRVTVNFEDAGKVVLDLDAVTLEVITPDWL